MPIGGGDRARRPRRRLGPRSPTSPWEPGAPKPDPILIADGVRRNFGGLTAVDVDHVEIQRGVITALIGPNGAGKTTFFNLLTNFDTPDSGTRTFDGHDARATSPPQDRQLRHGAHLPAHQGPVEDDVSSTT